MIKKIVLIGFGLEETGLNTAEFIYKRIFNLREHDDFYFTSKVCRIICLGDSWTFGMGAVRQKDYPAQLENILNNSASGDLKYKVYNLGYPNFTSSMAIKKFTDVSSRLKPNIVIAIIGRSDQWIFESQNIEKSLFERIKLGLLNTRIAKLIKVSIYNIRYNILLGKGNKVSGSKECSDKAMSLIAQGNDYRAKKCLIKQKDIITRLYF